MRIMALLRDAIVQKVKKLSGKRNISKSILIALKDVIDRRNISKAIQNVKRNPLKFEKSFSAKSVRELNRKD
jgi:hypothetical protein